MTRTATSRPAGDDFGAAHVAAGARARVAVSAELRNAYRALGRAPVARPVSLAGPPAAGPADADQDGRAAAPSGTDLAGASPDRAAASDPVAAARPAGPAGGFPVRLRIAASDGGPAAVVETARLVTLAGPTGHGAAWTLDLLVDATGQPHARLTLGLGPQGRSGTSEMAVALAAPPDLPAFLHGAATDGPGSLAVSGSDARTAPFNDCLTADGRLAPRPIR